jgi:single-strand DNA-binding protein
VGRGGTPSGQACTADSDKSKETEPNTMFNKIILIGRLGLDSEAKTAQNNKECVILNIATQETWKNVSCGQRERISR